MTGTAPERERVRARWTPPVALTATVLVAGVAALVARPVLLPAHGDPTSRLVGLFVVLGVIGAAWPLRAVGAAAGEGRPPLRVAAEALVLGSLAFTAGRLAMGGPAAFHPHLVRSLLLNSLAAVAEEAFFRRLLYGALVPFGTTVAVVVSAVAFAAVHVTVWGVWVLPLDLAAGLLLSWQRAASGRWTVPAATHVLANALALL